MPHREPHPFVGTGSITHGPGKDDGLVPRTLEFIREQVHAWRDDPRRPTRTAEKGLNSSLCDFLDVQQRRSDFAMVRFKHESPQAGRSTADIGVHGLDEITFVGAHSYGIYDPFLVIECKRLPTPGGREREREYVIGPAGSNASPTGGIQRFKLGLHGSRVESAAIVGYLEKHTPDYWHRQINQWLSDLAEIQEVGGTFWNASERLRSIQTDQNSTAWCDSEHPRVGDCITSEICLRHIWVSMS